MLDSIVFRIHNLQKHEALVKFLDRSGIQGSGISGKTFDNPESAFDTFQRKIHMKQMFHDYESGKHRDFVYRNHLPSYHNDIAYSINYDREFIEFNFSIPKYLYGTNVFQFVPHYFDKGFNESRFKSIEKLKDTIYDDLRAFLDWFFKKELNDLVNRYYVQIFRLDICYNKIFNTKQDAVLYLNDLKRIKKKFIRHNVDDLRVYHTTIYYASKSSGYTLKVYHKGTEFEINDKGKLKKAGWDLSQLEKVQALADRSLRYELEIKPKYMSNLFSRYIFRKDHDEWKRGLKYYRGILSNGYVTIKKQKLTLGELDKFRKKCYRYGKFYDGKVWHFYLESDSAIKLTTTVAKMEFEHSKFTFEREQRFTRELFTKMIKSFLDFKKEFTVNSRNPFDQFLNDIGVTKQPLEKQEKYFKDWLFVHKGINLKKISYRNVFRMSQRLKVESWGVIQDSNEFGRSSFFAIKKLFKQLGFDNPSSVMVVVPDELNGAFHDYHNAVQSIITNHYFKRFIRPF